MICIILRNIDTEANDYDLLLYCYLKVKTTSFDMAHVLKTIHPMLMTLNRLQVACGIDPLESLLMQHATAGKTSLRMLFSESSNSLRPPNCQNVCRASTFIT
jgi:hypothetical protein